MMYEQSSCIYTLPLVFVLMREIRHDKLTYTHKGAFNYLCSSFVKSDESMTLRRLLLPGSRRSLQHLNIGVSSTASLQSAFLKGLQIRHQHVQEASSALKEDDQLRSQARKKIREADTFSLRGSPEILVDRFQRKHTYLRISLTEKCNLRCQYCMPAEGIPIVPSESLLSAKEILRLARIFVICGVTKIRLTGGEPTLRKDLEEIIEGLNSLKQIALKQIGITTNGLIVGRRAQDLTSKGLTHYNVSLDTLDPFSFELMTRRPAAGLQKVLRTIHQLAHMPKTVVKVNVVVMKGFNDKEGVIEFIKWCSDIDITVRFIEFMPFDGNKWSIGKLVPYQTILNRIHQHFGQVEKIEDDPNDTTKHYKIPGAKGRFGFITSMSEHFCNTCNRLRITADGNIKVCQCLKPYVFLTCEIRIAFSMVLEKYQYAMQCGMNSTLLPMTI